MKKLGFTLLITSLLVGAFLLIVGMLADYNYENEYSNYWSLAEKASTIGAKQQLIEKFYNSLTNGFAAGHFASNDAIFLKTPNNSFVSNLAALHSLVQRLTEIQGMDTASFQYNTAIQQITAQEQGEAGDMLNVFSNCYYLASYPYLWGWIGQTVGIIDITFILLSLVIVCCYYINKFDF